MIFRWVMAAALICSWVTVGCLLTSCSSNDDNPIVSQVTLEDALKDGTIVVLTFNVNDEEFYVAFMRVGDTYELLDGASTRAEEPTVTEKDCEFSMEHDKANNLLKFTVKEKKSSDLVLTAIFDVKESTMEVIPGDSRFKVTGVKMKVSNIEITNLLKEKNESVTLADALVKGAKIEITYKWYSSTTLFTFTNDGGTFSCTITGDNAEYFTGSLKSEGTVLTFSAENWTDSESNLAIKFNVGNNTYKFWTVKHDVYNSHSISVNGTDITSSLTEERL